MVWPEAAVLLVVSSCMGECREEPEWLEDEPPLELEVDSGEADMTVSTSSVSG